MTKTTIVIPNYNGQKYLKDCMNSIVNQTSACDIIIVDNASTDDSVAWIADNYPDGMKLPTGPDLSCKVIALDTNTGFANAANVGIRAADTEYVFLLNNDTICRPDTVERLEYTMDRKKKAFSVQALMVSMNNPYVVDDSGDYYCALGWAFTDGKDKPVSRYSRRRAVTTACAGAAMYRKSLFTEVGYFDEAHFCYLEDVDLGIRARICGCINLMEPAAVVLHAGSATSGSRYNAFKQELTAANNIYLLYKNLPALMLICNVPLILLGIMIKGIYFNKKGLGKAYVKGLKNGMKKIISNTDKKVKYQSSNLGNYLVLQLELWVNLVRRLG